MRISIITFLKKADPPLLIFGSFTAHVLSAWTIGSRLTCAAVTHGLGTQSLKSDGSFSPSSLEFSAGSPGFLMSYAAALTGSKDSGMPLGSVVVTSPGEFAKTLGARLKKAGI